MACNKRTYGLPVIFLTAVILMTVCLTACSSLKPEPLPTESAPVETVPVEEALPPAEPTLQELVAGLNAAWEIMCADTNAVDATVAGNAAPGEYVLFSTPVAMPAGDRLARKWETRLGDFLADAERGFLEEHGIRTDFALVNAELIRAGLPEGDVTRSDLERVLPFPEKIVVVEVTGRQLMDLMQEIGSMPQGAAGFAQVSDGIAYTLTFDETGFGGSISQVTVGGLSVDAERVYRIAVNEFLADGGNGYSFFLRKDIAKTPTSVDLCGAIALYCSTHADALYMKQGERITVLGGIAE